jgi:gas vesicle protein
MDLWQMIAHDHDNITDLGRTVLHGMSGGVRSRDRLLDQLDGELRRHMEAMEESVYDALEDHDEVEDLVEELEDEQEEIGRELTRLARSGDKDGPDWTNRFEDFTYLLDQHFHRQAHELLPAARRILSPDQARALRHEFVEAKIEALRAGRGGNSTGLLLGALAGVAAGALVFAAWRSGQLRALTATGPERRFLHNYAEVRRRRRGADGRGADDR